MKKILAVIVIFICFQQANAQVRAVTPYMQKKKFADSIRKYHRNQRMITVGIEEELYFSSLANNVKMHDYKSADPAELMFGWNISPTVRYVTAWTSTSLSYGLLDGFARAKGAIMSRGFKKGMRAFVSLSVAHNVYSRAEYATIGEGFALKTPLGAMTFFWDFGLRNIGNDRVFMNFGATNYGFLSKHL